MNSRVVDFELPWRRRIQCNDRNSSRYYDVEEPGSQSLTASVHWKLRRELSLLDQASIFHHHDFATHSVSESRANWRISQNYTKEMTALRSRFRTPVGDAMKQ